MHITNNNWETIDRVRNTASTLIETGRVIGLGINKNKTDSIVEATSSGPKFCGRYPICKST